MSATARRGGRVIPLLALAAVALGALLVGWGLTQQDEPPTAPTAVGEVDPDSGASASSDRGANSPDETAQGQRPRPLPLSPPQRLRIPAIGVDTAVNPIGKNPDGSLAVPQPGPRLDQAAWFEQSPSPGQIGPSIIEGHVDTEQGPSVFYELAELRPGDEIVVTRKDGVTATFTVDALRDVPKAEFPTELVYGGKDLGKPTLRLITCSMFDPDIGTHVGNTLVFASLTDLERA